MHNVNMLEVHGSAYASMCRIVPRAAPNDKTVPTAIDPRVRKGTF